MKTNMSGWMAALAVFSLLGVGTRAMAQVWTAGGGTDRNWTNTANWSTGVLPTSSTAAYLGRDTGAKVADALITESGAQANWLYFGWASGDTGILTIASGDLTVARMYVANASNTVGKLVQSNGTVTVTDQHFRIGSGYAEGIYELHDGILNCLTMAVGPQTAPGAGYGRFEMHGGQLNSSGGLLLMSAVADSRSSFLMTGGVLSSDNIRVGGNGEAEFTQTGGTNNAATTFFVAYEPTSTGTYHLAGGELNTLALHLRNGVSRFEQANGTTVAITNDLVIGNNHADADARYILRGGTLNVGQHMYIPITLSAHSELRGWGAVTADRDLRMRNAEIRADGFGEDRELTLTYAGFPYRLDNTASTYGWYAVNRGKLTLPNVTVNVNASYWGERSGPDYVNAVRFNWTGRSGSGLLTGELLASDHTDVPMHAGRAKLAGVWHFTHSGFSITSAETVFRYDPAAVAALELAESELRVYRHTGTPGDAWQEQTATIDEDNKRITVTGLTDAQGYFAVGRLLPYRGTMVMVR